MTVANYLLAVVLSVSGSRLTIDKGLIDGVRAGDRGQVCYSLAVNENQKKLIEVIGCEVVDVDDHTAVVTMLGPARAQKGFFVQLSIPIERTSPAELMAIGRKRLEEGQLEAALTYFQRIKGALPSDPLVDSLITEAEKRKKEQANQREAKQIQALIAEAEKQIAAERFEDALAALERVLRIAPDNSKALQLKETATREAYRRKTMILVRSGTFDIGVDLPEAKFYNQHPRFKAELNSFWVDIASTNLLGYSYAEAEKHCRERGKRLPSEFELEAASQLAGFRVSANAEWTASWYLPYPGNKVKEKEYGEKYRVVRGPTDVRTRSYLLPTERAVDTSFRCACDP
jgi:tetratricopeptide (TPR) repeat protein